ncbi:guanine nucleotide-binding protein-like nsn1 [Quercus suber]|uniref:Guanine nucleotide-binding protein-like nsn1 n=1 Tax=Quercus suber TaxID=58331 RepID=A0AAW0LJ34_QUESU
MSFLRRRLPLPLPLGARFEPFDAVLISTWDIIGFSDEVYDKPPWDFCTDSTAVLDDEKHYFFTLLKRGKNHVLRSIGSYGTWHESSTKKIYDSGSGSGKTIIGFNKLLNFRVKGDGKKMKTTNWLMHEFSVAEKGSNLVLCVIYKKNKKKEEGGLALALARPPSVVVDSGILGSPKSVFYQVDFFDGIDDTDMGSQDPIVDSNILGSPKSVFDRVDFFDDMGMGGQDSYDDQDRFDESPRFAAIDGHSQFQAQKRKLGLLEDDDSSKLATCASPGELNVKDISTGVGKNRDNLDRAFYKELVKVIEASDVILEVLDARDPVGTRCVDMKNLVMKAGPNKHLVLLLNKIDLVPREAVEKWLKYLREELPVVAFKCSTQEQRSNLGWKSSSKAAKPSNLLQTSDFLGAETLIKLLKNYSRSHDKSITVGVIGLPNVGKSSLINSLKRSHVVTCQCWFYSWLNKIYARGSLDYLSVVMIRSRANDASITLRNCKRIEKLDYPIGPGVAVLVTSYKLPSFDSIDDFLQKVATVRGKLKKVSVVDVEAAARIGKIPYYTMPPIRNQGEPSEAKIVSELGKEFNIYEVYDTKSSFIRSLRSVVDLNPVEVPPSCPLNFDEDLLEAPKTWMMMVTMCPWHLKKLKKAGTKEKLLLAGMLNTKMKKAEEKRRKRAEKSIPEDAIDDEYDFKVNYVKKRSAMDVGDEDDGNQIIGKVPICLVLNSLMSDGRLKMANLFWLSRQILDKIKRVN